MAQLNIVLSWKPPLNWQAITFNFCVIFLSHLQLMLIWITYRFPQPVNNLQSSAATRADTTASSSAHSANFNPYQSACRKEPSTETALLGVFDGVYTAVDDKQVTVLIGLHLSAAFDTVDHEVGVTAMLLTSLHSYLEGRTQYVKLGQHQSPAVRLHVGVSSGPFSVSCCLRYTVASGWCYCEPRRPTSPVCWRYRATSCHARRQHIRLTGQVYRWSQAVVPAERTPAQSRQIGGIDHRHHQSAAFCQLSRFISVYWRSRSTSRTSWWDESIRRCARPATDVCETRHGGGAIMQLPRENHPPQTPTILSTDLATAVACSLILSRLDYCNSLLHGAPTGSISTLQCVQNSAARIVLPFRGDRAVHYCIICTGCQFVTELTWLFILFREYCSRCRFQSLMAYIRLWNRVQFVFYLIVISFEKRRG